MQEKKKKRLFMTHTSLKIYAGITLFCYYVSIICLQRGMLHIDQHTLISMRDFLRENPQAMTLAGTASFLQLAGGLGLPVVAFLLAEGAARTENYRNYLLRMLAFALISEIPYDLAMSGKMIDFQEQNMLFTLVLGLIMLYGIRLFENRPGAGCRAAQVAVTAAAILWSMLLRTEFGFFLLILSAVYYMMKDRKGLRILMGCAMGVMYVTAPLSGYVLWLYEGARGRAVNRWVFYAVYPAALMLLFVLSRGLGG